MQPIRSVLWASFVALVVCTSPQNTMANDGGDAGISLPIGDNDSFEAPLPFSYSMCGVEYDSVFVNANGSLTFGAPDSTALPTGDGFRSGPPRIAGLWFDLNPGAGGEISIHETMTTFTVTYAGVPASPDVGSNSFSITLRRSGNRAVVAYDGVDAVSGLAGISCGGQWNVRGDTDDAEDNSGCGIESTGNDPGQAYGTEIFLRGSFDGFMEPADPNTRFENLGNSIYEVELELDAQFLEFKVASSDWSIQFGNADVDIGIPATLEESSGFGTSATISIVEAGCYNFSLDTTDRSAPVLLVTRVEEQTDCSVDPTGNDPAEAYGTEVYLRGSFNDWADPPVSSDRFENLGNENYAVAVQLGGDDIEFKVASADWSIQFGDVDVELNTPVVLPPTGGFGTNARLSLQVPGCYSFLLDTTESFSPVLTVTSVIPFESQDLSEFPRGRVNASRSTLLGELFDGDTPFDLDGRTLIYSRTRQPTDVFERNNDIATATHVTLPFDTSTDGFRTTLAPAGDDVDYFAFAGSARDRVSVDVVSGTGFESGEPLNTLIALFDSSGNLIASDDDGQGVEGGLSRLTDIPLQSDDTYLVAVSRWPDFDFDGLGGDGGVGRYVLEITKTSSPPGTVVPLGDDDFREIPMSFAFPFNGQVWTSVFINSNGNLTFGAGDRDPRGSGEDLVNGPPRIAMLWDDLDPGASGFVTYEDLGLEFRVNFIDVPRSAGDGANNFSATLRDDGSISTMYGAIASPESVVGVTPGLASGEPECGVDDQGLDNGEAFGGLDVFVRGIDGEWGTSPSRQFINFGNDIYEAQFASNGGVWQYKIADASWDGYAVAFLGFDTPLNAAVPLEDVRFGGPNGVIDLGEPGCFNWMLDTTDPTTPVLTVTRVVGTEPPPGCRVDDQGLDNGEAFGGRDVFVRGIDGDWDTSPSRQFINFGNDIYQAQFASDGGVEQYKIADASWDGYAVAFLEFDTPLNSPVPLEDVRFGGPNGVIDLGEPGCFNWTLDTTDPTTPVLTVTRVETGPPPGCRVDDPGLDNGEAFGGNEVFVRGIDGDWSAQPGRQFYNFGNDVYQAEFPANAGFWEYKIADVGWSSYAVAYTEGQTPLDMPVVLGDVRFGGPNGFIELPSTGCYNWTLATTDPASPTLIVTRVGDSGGTVPDPVDLSSSPVWPAAGTTWEQFDAGNPFDLGMSTVDYLP